MRLKINEQLVCIYTKDKDENKELAIPNPDVRLNKPIGIHDQKNNQTVFFQKIITTSFNEKEISIAIPNEISLALSISRKSLDKAIIKKKELIEKSNKKPTIYDDDVKTFFDFIEEIQKSIVFSYKSIEAFCNATIPESFTYTKKTNKGTFESYGKEQIERWITTSEKISEIIPKILDCDSPVSEEFWSNFKNLERIRNEIIHSKSNNSIEIIKEFLSEKIKDYIDSSLLLLNYFIILDPDNPIFPLGFGKSKIKVISMPDIETYLSKI